MRGQRLIGALITAGVAIASSGCATAHTVVRTHVHTIRITRTAHPRVTVVKTVHRIAIGRPAELLDAETVDGVRAQVDLVLAAGRPKVSTTALSSYAYAPQHGYYLTFTMTIRNRGEAPVFVKPTQFSVDVGPGETHVTSYDGNAPYDGAHTQLDAVPLAPGQSLRKPLTFDVSATHGTLTYAPERKPAIVWRF